MQIKLGTRLQSQVCTTQVVVVRAPSADIDLKCGGAPMVDLASAVEVGAAPEPGSGTKIGKRYANEELDLELLCTKPGSGALSVGDVPLGLKEAKSLPSSD